MEQVIEALKSLKPQENQELKKIEWFFPKKMGNNEIENEIDDIKKSKKKNLSKRLNI